LPRSYTAMIPAQYHHMNLINACWKQLNIKHLRQQVLVAPNIELCPDLQIGDDSDT